MHTQSLQSFQKFPANIGAGEVAIQSGADEGASAFGRDASLADDETAEADSSEVRGRRLRRFRT